MNAHIDTVVCPKCVSEQRSREEGGRSSGLVAHHDNVMPTTGRWMWAPDTPALAIVARKVVVDGQGIQEAARAFLDGSRGHHVQQKALSQLVAASPHGKRVKSLKYFEDPKLNDVATQLAATQLAYKNARRDGKKGNTIASADLNKALEKVPDHLFAARGIIDRTLNTYSNGDDVATRFDELVDDFVSLVVQRLHDVEAHRCADNAKSEELRQDTAAEYQRLQLEWSNELKSEQEARHAVLKALGKSLMELEATWSQDVTDFNDAAEYAAVLHGDQVERTVSRHREQIKSWHATERRVRAENRCLHAEVASIEVQAVDLSDALRVEAQTAAAYKALALKRELELFQRQQDVEELTKQVHELTEERAQLVGRLGNEQILRVQREADARKMTNECVRLRKIQADVLDEYIVNARTARQRLFFESLKSSEQKQPSLTRRGWRDEPFTWGADAPFDDPTLAMITPPQTSNGQSKPVPSPTPPCRRSLTWRSPPVSPRVRGPVGPKLREPMLPGSARAVPTQALRFGPAKDQGLHVRALEWTR